ncbi:hypothetical protein ElyMa_004029000 [Elysia marginata]|uniref:Uncharacterized protein n=1 Tax=Elysia marginata TaxID=1093978 RepID=A0AAV4G3G9_9GAST|nr:hypothetical protein ElyMa_004029000 [Elysia marginata]
MYVSDITDLEGPDLHGITPQASRLGMNSRDGLVHNDEVVNNSTAPTTKPPLLPSATDPYFGSSSAAGTENYGSESVVSGSHSFHPSDKGDNSSSIQQAISVSSKRPQSASYLQTSSTVQPTTTRRPRTAVDFASRKAVRFADQSAQEVNNKGAGEASAKTKKSCRPQSLDSGFHDREDPEDDHGESRGLKTFLTQQSVGSSKNSKAPSDNSSQQNGKSDFGQGKKVGPNNVSQNILKSNCQEKSKPKSSSESERLATLQEIYGLKPACLSYTQEAGKSQMQSKQSNNKQSLATKGTASNIKRKLDHRFAMYQKKEKENKKENYTKQLKEGEKRDGEEVDEREPIDKDTELRQVVKKFFKPADFTEKSHKSHRPQHAQSRKAKALKLLQAKTNSRPFSATTYSDRIVSDKKLPSNRLLKNMRPESAEMFSEKSKILSKHGLLKSHTNSASCTSQRPNSGSYLISIKSNDSSSSDIVKQAETQVNDNNEVQSIGHTISEARATGSASSRPKSASRVTFAATKHQKRPTGSRVSSAPCLRNNRDKKNPSRQNSAISQDSGRTSLSGVEDDGILDADAMWAELSSDDTDDDIRDTAGAQNLVTEEDFFMAKFDLLDLQFEAVKAQLRQDKLKSVLKQNKEENSNPAVGKSLVPQYPSLQASEQGKNDLVPDNEIASPVWENHSSQHLSSTQSVFLTHSDPTAVVKTMVSETYGIISQPTESHESKICPELFTSLPQDSRLSFTTMAEHQRLQISSQLYKKTNVYVEVSSLDRTRPKSASKIKNMSLRDKKNPEPSPQNNTSLKDREGFEEHKGVEAENDTSAVVSPSTIAESKSIAVANKLETQKLQTKQEMQRDYPMLLGVKVELQPQSPQQFDRNDCKNVKFGVDMPGAVEENFNQCGNYQEMLDAYRRHCIEGSEESDGDSDTDTFKRLAKPKKPQVSQNKGSLHTGRRSVNTNRDMGKNMKLHIQMMSEKSKSRPISATTNDSGWESDCQQPISSDVEFHPKAPCTETPLTFSHHATDIVPDWSTSEVNTEIEQNPAGFMNSSALDKEFVHKKDEISSEVFCREQYHMPTDPQKLSFPNSSTTMFR